MQKGKLLRLDKRGTRNAPWLSQPLTFSSDLPTSLCLFSDPLVITGYLSGFTFQEKPKVFYRNNKWLDQEQFLFAFSGQTYDSWVLFYGLFYCHFRARIRQSLSLKQVGNLKCPWLGLLMSAHLVHRMWFKYMAKKKRQKFKLMC